MKLSLYHVIVMNDETRQVDSYETQAYTMTEAAQRVITRLTRDNETSNATFHVTRVIKD